ncbi:MAG: glycosyltransferase [Terriglobales bacterium]
MNPLQAPFLTVVLAVKDPEARQCEACIAAIAALRHSPRFDLVIVASGRVPAISDSCRSRLHRVSVLEWPPRGIYDAYNRGIDDARTPYVMVMGVDDLLLPGLDTVIDAMIDAKNDTKTDAKTGAMAAGGRPHMVAACALMQGIGIMRPSRFRWGLIFKNWCQQGLLYRTDTFVARRFDCRYPVQADHKFNMELVSDPRTVICHRDEVICHFAAGGLSQTIHDWAFREDMPEMVRACYGWPFWIVALAKKWVASGVKNWSQVRAAESEVARLRKAASSSRTDLTPRAADK